MTMFLQYDGEHKKNIHATVKNFYKSRDINNREGKLQGRIYLQNKLHKGIDVYNYILQKELNNKYTNSIKEYI